MRTSVLSLFLAAALLPACQEDQAYQPSTMEDHDAEDMASQGDQGTTEAPDASPDAAPEDLGPQEDMEPQEDAGGPDISDEPDLAEGCQVPPLDPAPGLVLTDKGWVQGRVDGNGWAYHNIPFAAAPEAELRWKPPQPAACWEDTRDATTVGPRCLQVDPAGGDPVGQEDCLQLNIWTPEDNTQAPQATRPVLFYIHGGGNIVGSAVQELVPNRTNLLFQGRRLATGHDAVVVTINYRLGVLGFLAHPALSAESEHQASGNYANLDQIAALEWVQRNIARFGGDPDKVMVFGESAGSVNTCVMYTSPLARGLFAGALMQSAPCLHSTLPQAEAVGAQVVQLAGCEGDDPVGCLRQQDGAQLVASVPVGVGLSGRGTERLSFGPTVEGWVLPQSPYDLIQAGQQSPVPLVLGSNADEMASEQINGVNVPTEEAYDLTLRASLPGVSEEDLARIYDLYPLSDYETPNDAFIQVSTDIVFTCPKRTLARYVARSQVAPVYQYFFSRRAQTAREELPARHGIELVYIFGTLQDVPLYRPAQEDLDVSRDMMELWTSFARDGAPAAQHGPTWEPFTLEQESYLEITAPLRLDTDLRADKCDLWDELLGLGAP